MLRRAVPVLPARRLAASATQSTLYFAAELRASACRVSTHMSVPIGQGKVIPRKCDYIRPAYSVPTMTQWFLVIGAYLWTCSMPTCIGAFLLIWGLHGGFTGALPPDPHDLHK